MLDPKFLAFLEAAPDAIVVVAGDGVIVAVNSLTEKMFDYRRDELLGQRIEMLVPERYRGRHVHERSDYADAPRTRPMGAGRPLTGRRSDGAEFPVEISLSPLQTDQAGLVMSIVRDITERRRAEELLQASLREKEALLREIHHRVKNNLQVTSSLLRLQAGAIDDPRTREVFEETQNRIRSMALVHEKLYQSTNLSRIDFSEYIRTLAALLFRSFGVGDEIALDVGGGGVFLSVEAAVPCGLIVNELLSNALKHAFQGRRRGTIHVLLEQHDGRCTISVADDGVGLPPNLDLETIESLGLHLVRSLVDQLEGQLEIRRGGGAEFRFSFDAERGNTNV